MQPLTTLLRHSIRPLHSLYTRPTAHFATTVTEASAAERLPGHVGLEFDPEWRTTLKKLYEETLVAVKQIPSDVVYRSNVEKVTKYRLKVVEDEGEKGVRQVERTLGVGPIEEVIEQAKDELKLVPEMIAWQPWKTKEGKESIKIEVID